MKIRNIRNEVTGFQWNKHNILHIADHNVLPKEAEEVFFDTNNVLDDDIDHSLEEERFIIIGRTKKGRLLYQVFTIRRNKIRVISSRDISKKKEVILYEKATHRTKV